MNDLIEKYFFFLVYITFLTTLLGSEEEFFLSLVNIRKLKIMPFGGEEK